MKLWKRMIVVLLASLLCCGMFSGCAKEDTVGPLTVYVEGCTPDYMAEATRVFKSTYPDVEIVIRQIDAETEEEEEQQYTALKTELMAGTGPDVVLIGNGFAHYTDINKAMAAGNFIDLNPYFEKDESWSWDDYNTTVIDAFELDGKQYLMPLYYDVWTTVSEKSLLEKYGFNVDNCSTGKGLLEEIAKYYEQSAADETMPQLFQYTDSWYRYIIDVMGLNPLDHTKKTVAFSEDFAPMLDTYKIVYPFDRHATLERYLNSKAKYSTDGLALEEFLLYGWYGHTSLRAMGEAQLITDFGEPVVLPFYNYGSSDTSAQIQLSVGVTASSPRKQMAYTFVKALMGETALTQEKTTSDGRPTSYEVSCPVNNQALKKIWKLKELDKAYTAAVGSSATVVHLKALDESYLTDLMEWNSKVTHVFYACGSENGNVISYFEDYLEGEMNYEEALAKAENTLKIYISE